jgi:hypothetical protein
MSQYAPDLFDPKKKLKNYKDYTTYFIIGYVIVLGILLTIGLSSCNTTTRAYKAIERHEPKKSEDTARLLKRAAPLLKTPAPIVKQGRTIVRTVKVPEKVKVLDTAQLRKVTDSISAQYQKDGIAITKDCEQSVNDALKRGIKQGYSMKVAESVTFEDKEPDTVFLANDSLAAVLITTRIDLNKANGEVIKQTAKKDTYRGLFWVLLALLIVSGALNVKQLLSTKSLIKKYP